MIILHTTALLNWEVSIEHVAQEMRFLSLYLVHGIVNKLEIKQVSKLSLEKGSLRLESVILCTEMRILPELTRK